MTSDSQIVSREIALITGASRGIGRAVARGLAASGRFVYINYRSSFAPLGPDTSPARFWASTAVCVKCSTRMHPDTDLFINH